MKPSKIKYQIIGEHGLWQSYQSEGLILEVVTEEVDCGYVQISEVQSKINDGVATLDLSILRDGIYEPLLVCKDRVIRLEAIKKFDGTIAPQKTSDETVRRLLKRVMELERITPNFEERLLAIEEKIQTEVLF